MVYGLVRKNRVDAEDNGKFIMEPPNPDYLNLIIITTY